MPRRRKFDKRSAQTFSVVHRSHEDSLFFDNDASKHVLVKAPGREQKKIYSTNELEKQLTADELESIRGNEGLAAQYGIFFDDSKYDYMQHLKPMGMADSVFIAKEEAKEKKNIEDLLKDNLPSETTRKVTHDTFENIPQELRGFKPEMDTRLREVLEALEDEAYIGEEDAEKDIFSDLLESGQVEDDEFYGTDEDFDEWDVDNYDDEFEHYNLEDHELENPYNEGEAPEQFDKNVVSSAWQKDFMKFERETKNEFNDWDSDDDFEEEDDVVGELPTVEGASKKKKNRLRKKMGAMTDTTSFSMTSSALFRTEGLTLLDDRYEQLAKKFETDAEVQPKEFDMAQERPDLEGMLDDFLDNYEFERGGRKLMKKDSKIQAIKDAADSVSKSKLAARRKKDTEEISVGQLGGSFGKLGI